MTRGQCALVGAGRDLTPRTRKRSVVGPVIESWARIVEAEYREFPGLNLTMRQVKRLWGLDEATCVEVLDTLEAEHVLTRTKQDQYVRAFDLR